MSNRGEHHMEWISVVLTVYSNSTYSKCSNPDEVSTEREIINIFKHKIYSCSIYLWLDFHCPSHFIFQFIPSPSSYIWPLWTLLRRAVFRPCIISARSTHQKIKMEKCGLKCENATRSLIFNQSNSKLLHRVIHLII